MEMTKEQEIESALQACRISGQIKYAYPDSIIQQKEGRSRMESGMYAKQRRADSCFASKATLPRSSHLQTGESESQASLQGNSMKQNSSSSLFKRVHGNSFANGESRFVEILHELIIFVRS